MKRPAMHSMLIAQMLLALSLPAFAQQDDSSLDALWSEGQDSTKSQPAKQDATTSRSKTTKQPTSIDTSPNFKVTTGGASETTNSKPDFSTTSEATEAAAASSASSG